MAFAGSFEPAPPPEEEEDLPVIYVEPEPVGPWSGSFAAAPTGDADMGFTATGVTPDPYVFDDAWYPPTQETGRRPPNVGAGPYGEWAEEHPWDPNDPSNWGETEDTTDYVLPPDRVVIGQPNGEPMSYEDFSSPRGPRISGAAGMDPQLRDLRDGPLDRYVAGMHDIAPSLGGIGTAPGWYGSYDDITQSLDDIPPTMFEGRPGLRGTIFGQPEGTQMAGGVYYPDRHAVWGRQPATMEHELSHAMDFQGTGSAQISGPGSPFAEAVQPAIYDPNGPYVNGWGGYYGDQYFAQGAPNEALAEGAKNLMRGMPSGLPPEADRILREQLFQLPPGPINPNNPFVPGSASYYNYERWLQQQQAPRPVAFYRARGDW